MNQLILEILKSVDLSKPFRYVQAADISTSGSIATLTVKTDPQRGMYVRRHRISAFYKDSSTNKSIAIVESLTARDILNVELTSGSSAVQTENPMDIFAFNDECNDHDYPGYVIPAATTLTFKVSHTALSVANFGVPIRVMVTLAGWQLKEG
ncbi:MAG: hypothetical protein JSS89_12235 [Bacteroidetes bacterium]|nr:hypothetical protein [Bacteroidota bacterium]